MRKQNPLRRNDLLDSLLLEQHGVISQTQALAAGATQRRINFLLASGRWRRIRRSVYRHATHQESFEHRAIAACLAASKDGIAVASGLTAARVHGLDGAVLKRGRRDIEPDEAEKVIQVTATKRARVRGFKTYVDRRLDEEDFTFIGGVPVMTVERTIVDLYRRFSRWRVERALDDALRRKLTDLDKLQVAVDRARGYGRKSMKGLDRILAARSPEDALTESRLEQRVLRALRGAELPTPTPQHPVEVKERTYHLDLAYPDARLGIEVDGFEYHRSRRAFDIDRSRANDLLLAGWTILRLTSKMKNAEIAEVVGRALSSRAT